MYLIANSLPYKEGYIFNLDGAQCEIATNVVLEATDVMDFV